MFNTQVRHGAAGSGSASGLAYNSQTNLLYASDLDQQLRVIDPVQRAVIANVPTGKASEGVAVSEKLNRVYVVNATDDSVTVVDGGNNTVVQTVSVKPAAPMMMADPLGVAVDDFNGVVYVTNQMSSSVSVIDAKTFAVTNIAVANDPVGVIVSPVTHRAYVTTLLADFVTIIENQAIAGQVTVGTLMPQPGPTPYVFVPTQMAINTRNNTVYVPLRSMENVAYMNGGAP